MRLILLLGVALPYLGCSTATVVMKDQTAVEAKIVRGDFDAVYVMDEHAKQGRPSAGRGGPEVLKCGPTTRTYYAGRQGWYCVQ